MARGEAVEAGSVAPYRPCLAVEQVGAGEVTTLALAAGIIVLVAVGQPALLHDPGAAARVDPYGG